MFGLKAHNKTRCMCYGGNGRCNVYSVLYYFCQHSQYSPPLRKCNPERGFRSQPRRGLLSAVPPGPCPPNRGTETELETLLNHTVGHPVAPKFIKPNASIYERPQGCHGAPLPPFGDDSPRHSPLEALRARCVSRRVLATRLAHGTQPSLPVSHRGDQKRRRCCAAGGCETPASEEGGAGRQKEAGRWRGRTGIVGCGLASLCSM